MQQHRTLEDLWLRLQQSAFRSRFRLNQKERAYLRAKGMPVILSHAHDFIHDRLTPAQPVRDGKQTPWRGHPVFVAQHATATCCRGCLEKWHGIAKGQPLTDRQQEYIVQVIALWLRRQEESDDVSADR
ncbi:DUF4186 domain-containing protein [Acerihabitans sp. KWT182]|uniref:DUF4186 domain-containing protein n=1 Tax=Acerihabitans sp. KWT182 TaxID=3157919 RepID=A0AAU7Q681_9GAMM